MVTWNDVEHYKPDPRVFDGILHRLDNEGIRRDEIVYVGDNLVDLSAAQGAGLHFLAVTTGVTGKRAFLRKGLGSQNVLRSFTDLPEKLKHF